MKKLEAVAEFLKNSSRISLQSYNYSILVSYIKNEPTLRNIIASLLDKNKEHEDGLKKAISVSVNGDHVWGSYRRNGTINSFDNYAACCWYYLNSFAELIAAGKNPIDNFITKNNSSEDVESRPPRLQFYYECIDPIIVYIKLQMESEVNAIDALKRYKVLCEWYDRETIFNQEEKMLTQKHLSKYLFDQGFTYSLSETNVPSGRIDNFAISIGISENEIRNLPSVIVIEGKIYKGRKSIFVDVKNQVAKRLSDLNIVDGYCVIYNQTNENIKFDDSDGNISGVDYVLENGKKLFCLVINLGEDFFKSTKSLDNCHVKLK